MNYCSNCGAKVNQGENYCTNCGNRLNNQTVNNYNNLENYYEPQKSIDDEFLYDAYIGANASKIKTNDFSFGVFFLGIFYLFYRKMWKVGFVWLGLSIFLNLLNQPLAGMANLGIRIYLAIEFKHIYQKHVFEQIKNIKEANAEKTSEEIAEICRAKGGTTFIPIVILIIGYVVLVFIIVFLMIGISGINSYPTDYDDFDFNSQRLDSAITRYYEF